MRPSLWLMIAIANLASSNCTTQFIRYQCTYCDATKMNITGDEDPTCQYLTDNYGNSSNDIVCSLNCPTSGYKVTDDSGELFDEVDRRMDGYYYSVNPAEKLDYDTTFNCVPADPRCGLFVTQDGETIKTSCNRVDTEAVCNEDMSMRHCTCSAGYTGDDCGMTISEWNILESTYGSDTTTVVNLMREARTNPAALQNLLSVLLGYLPDQDIADLTFTLEDTFESMSYEGQVLAITDANLAHYVDNSLGACYTFNHPNTAYANQTASVTGTRGDLMAQVKVNDSESLPWVESQCMQVYITDPGVNVFVEMSSYRLRPAGIDDITVTRTVYTLIGDCVSDDYSATSFTQAGLYTLDGCYRSCYQTQAVATCACVDPNYPFPAGSTKCNMTGIVCVNQMSVDLGNPATWESCICPPECSTSTFALTGTRTEYPEPICDSGDTECEEFLTKRTETARIRIRLGSMEVQTLEESMKLSFSWLLTQLGGMLGLIAGICVGTIIETCLLFGKLAVIAFKAEL